ncbi:PucR family transcriptional regulator [Leucobacter komagatae]|uniref:PucR family transcriptional regulator n=2 Tax=Leucobacter komagatae TaxID=55969 RepID=A0A0D0I034_9MICO|nr:PucR family transcriptional regulator [Leucobacter komagatae]
MLPNMSDRNEPRFPRFSFARILDDLGVTLLETAHGRANEQQPVGGVVIFDAFDEPLYPEHAFVLGVGVHGSEALAELIEGLPNQPVAAVVVRSPVELTDEVRRAADERGVVVLGLARGATWTQLAALLRTLLAEDDVGDTHVDSLGGIPSGDLFAVANAIASLLDAPVTIEDRSSRVLAFSGRQEEADRARAETIIGRRVPERYTERLTERGVFRHLYRSDDPVVIDSDVIDSVVSVNDGSTQRVAIGVRAGDEVLGSIWAAMDGPLTHERTVTLRDAAKLVALHLLRLRAGADVQRRLRAELLSTALEGGSGASEALARLNLSGQSVCVVAAVLTETEHGATEGTDQALMAERERFTDALAVHLSAMRPGSAVAQLGDTAYGILPEPNDPSGLHAVRTMEDFLDRVGARMPAVIAVGPPADDLAGITRSRGSARRVLRALLETGRGGSTKPLSRVARLSDVHAEVLMRELKDLMVVRGDEFTGPVSRLIEHDGKQKGQLVDTLRAWFDHFGDVGQAAGTLFVHPNTFRYRLRRAVEISGIDLDDADDRFAAMLQLRLLDR